MPSPNTDAPRPALDGAREAVAMAWTEPVPVWMGSYELERCWLFCDVEQGYYTVVGPNGERRLAGSLPLREQALPGGVYLTRLKAAYVALPQLERSLAGHDQEWEKMRQDSRERLERAIATCRRILAGQE